MSDVEFIIQEEIVEAVVYALKKDKSWIDSPVLLVLVSGSLTLLGSLFVSWINANKDFKLRQLETKLTAQESVLSIQLEALKSLLLIKHELSPSIWPSPDFESTDAYTIVFSNMDKLRTKLNIYLQKYSFVISEDIIKQIDRIIFTCNIQTYEGVDTDHEYRVTKPEETSAMEVVDNLDKIFIKFKKELNIIRG